jgi:TorA maturation chaperone TorD
MAPALTGTRAELFRALGVFAEPPGPGHARLAAVLGVPEPSRSDWTEAFVVQLVPHASIYLGPEGMLGGEAADRVAGFWRALRQPVPADPDHLTALLGLYATLVDAEADEPDEPRRLLWRQARTALLHEHLLCWLLVYTAAMVEVGSEPFAQWAELLRATLESEAADVGVPQRLPTHLTDVPMLSPAAERLRGWLGELLAPARSGVVVTRADLGGAARRAGLALRLGDRRRMLGALLEQDPAATLGWLAGHARMWMTRHRADQPTAGPIAGYWADRALATTEQLVAAMEQLADTDQKGVSP